MIEVAGRVFTPEQIARIMGGVQSSCNYWMDTWEVTRSPYSDKRLTAVDPRLYAGDFQFKVVADGAENTVDRGDVERALAWLYHDNPYDFWQLYYGRMNKPSVDRFWQLCVFDAVIYFV